MSDLHRDSPIEPTPARMTHSQRWLRLIALYKAFKTICLILVAIAAFHLNRSQNFDHLVHWLEQLSLSDSNGLRWRLVHKLQTMGPSKFVAIGLVALAYAAIFATEGVGLWLQKYWAEWFTVIATGSLVPLEVYEAIHRFSVFKLLALIANIAIVAYLVRVALQSRRSRTVH
jgi:uncharacterized membrane protein (DUF2068 family)